jgi:outer membrane assembly lipoprotein YfiO
MGASRPKRLRFARAARRGARIVAWVLLAVVAGSCGGRNAAVQGPGAEGEFLEGRAAYERGDQMRAIEILSAFERNHPGSHFIDDAMFYLGKAHQANSEQILARQSFQRLLDAFPRSSYAEDAQFELAQSWLLSMRGPALDPEPAEQAVVYYDLYLRRYPDGKHRELASEGIERARGNLARKDFLNGRTYLRLNRPEAARRYFRKSIERWADAPVSAKAMEGVAITLEREGQAQEAREAYAALLEHVGDDPGRFEDGERIAAAARRRLADLRE